MRFRSKVKLRKPIKPNVQGNKSQKSIAVT
jgi:hypothetical protein